MKWLNALIYLIFTAITSMACGNPDEASTEVRDFGLTEPLEDQELNDNLSQSPSAIVRRAIELKNTVDLANRSDLQLLLERLFALNLDREQYAEIVVKAEVLGEREKLLLGKLRVWFTEHKSEAREYPPLTTSLDKLIGTEQATGILDDAISDIKANADSYLAGQLLSTNLRQNKITVKKTALLLLLAAASESTRLPLMTDIVKNLNLLYPAVTPGQAVVDGLLDMPFLANAAERTLYVPNAGYVFGGEKSETTIRGLDCSSFAGLAAELSTRPSTLSMEYAWREMRGEEFPDDPNSSVRTRLATSISDIKAKFKPVIPQGLGAPADDGPLQAGDLVVWRYPLESPSRSGHVAIVATLSLPFDVEASFIGVENNRTDDKTIEGINIRGFALTRPDSRLFVLRPR